MASGGKRPHSETEHESTASPSEPPMKKRKINIHESDIDIPDPTETVPDTGDAWNDVDFGEEEDGFDDSNDSKGSVDEWAEEPDDIEMAYHDNIEKDNSFNQNEETLTSSTSNTVDAVNTNTNSTNSNDTNAKYEECWICTNCGAINRLLDTLSNYEMHCVNRCDTYNPGTTEIVKAFEWDMRNPTNNNQSNGGGGVHHQNNHNNHNGHRGRIAHPHGIIRIPGTDHHGRVRGQALGSTSSTNGDTVNGHNNNDKQNGEEIQYSTKDVHNKEGDLLIMGLIRQNNVCIGNTIDIVPQDVIRLALLFHGEFEHDGWDTLTNADDFEINNGLTVCTRTARNNGLWRNCFGIRELKGNGKELRYEWVLKCMSRQHQEWKEDLIDSIIVGVIEAKGAKGNMNAAYTQYSDGFGWCGDGQFVNDMKYKDSPVRGFSDESEIKVTLQWTFDNKSRDLKCQVWFQGVMAFELDARKSYRFAVAMKDRKHYLEWKSFEKRDHPRRDNTY